MRRKHISHNEATTCNTQEKQDGTTAIHKENRVLSSEDKENNSETAENLPVRNKKRNIQTQNNKQSGKRTVASHRLEKTVEYTNNLVDLTRTDQQIRNKYYRKKVKLMKKELEIKERIATALENLSNVFPFTAS